MEKNNLELLLPKDPSGTGVVYEWVYNENNFWKTILGRFRPDFFPYEESSLTKYSNVLEEQIEYHQRNRYFERHKLDRIINLSKKSFIPNHDHRVARDIYKNVDDHQSIQQILYTSHLIDQTIDQFFSDSVITKYKEILEEKIKEFEKEKQNFTSSTQYLSSNLVEQSERLTEEITEIVDTSKKDLTDQASAHRKELSETSSNIKKNIDSSKPVEFWEAKELNHKTHARNCKITAISLGIFASFIMLFLILAAFKDLNTTFIFGFQLPNHFYLAALILIGSAFVWALRIAVQLMMTHAALESEALERSTAIKTYIALSSQNIDKEIEKEFHKSLLSFNKVKISEDSSHPEIFKIVEQFLKKDKP